ncbi:MAG TPA: class F sortase [Roseiflexaceae bacterium]
MRQHRWTIILGALLLGACGGAQQAAQPAASTAPPVVASPPAAPATTAPNTAAPPTSAPGASTAANADPPAAPTAQLILPPTDKPAAAGQPATPAPAARPAGAQSAPPKPAPTLGGGPVRLVIKDVKLDYDPVSVGLDKNRVPIVPDHDVGWYNLSAGPGQGENIVLWGHVLRFRSAPKTPAPFAHLKDLKPGASVVLYDRAGAAHNYTITKQVWVRPDQIEYILPQGKEMVTMVSCIGDKVIQDGEVVDESHRLITIAEPA